MLACVFILAVYGTLTIVETNGQSDFDWLTWKLVHQKIYSDVSSELIHRHIWEENYRLVQKHNTNANATFTMELNHLADQKQRMHSLTVTLDEPILRFEHHLNNVPDAWDWRKQGCVGPVQDQGQMGDNVPIVATECVDSFHCTKTRNLVSASVVEMHDCCAKTPIASNHIFQCVHDIGGLCSTGDYPRSTGVCKNSTCQAVATVNGGKQVPTGDETAMKAAVYTTPVFALVDASHPSFQLYRAGTYIEPRCSSSMLDHALQVVGYGSASGVDYWICKNSWGVSWGMQGYIYIARNKGNMCGIASFTIYPV